MSEENKEEILKRALYYQSQYQGKRILNTFKINTKQSIVFKNLKKH